MFECSAGRAHQVDEGASGVRRLRQRRHKVEDRGGERQGSEEVQRGGGRYLLGASLRVQPLPSLLILTREVFRFRTP